MYGYRFPISTQTHEHTSRTEEFSLKIQCVLILVLAYFIQVTHRNVSMEISQKKIPFIIAFENSSDVPQVSTIRTASHCMGLPFTQVGNKPKTPALSFQSKGHRSVAHGRQQWLKLFLGILCFT